MRYNLAGTQSWIPYGYYGDSNKPGIFAEVLKAILARANMPYQFYYFPPKRAEKVIDEGLLDLDFMSPSWFKDGNMGEEFVSTKAIFSLSEYIVTLAEHADQFATPESIYGRRIGTIAGYSYYDDDKFIRVDFLSESALIEGLQKQRFQAVILEARVANFWASEYQVDIALAALHSHGDIVIRLRKELGYLLPTLNKVIESLLDDGSIDAILRRYAVK